MGVAPRSYTASYAGGPGGGGGGSRNERVVEHRTHSQPVYIDKVEARDYSDFLRQLDLQSSFHSMPGNGG